MKVPPSTKGHKRHETNYDMLFIRKLREEGKLVIADERIELSLLYPDERDEMFQGMEKAKKTGPKKKGPRHILHPELMEDSISNLGSPKFDAADFRARLSQALPATSVLSGATSGAHVSPPQVASPPPG